MRRITVVIILLSLFAVQVAWADVGYIGSIKTLNGTVEVIRQGDVVHTGHRRRYKLWSILFLVGR